MQKKVSKENILPATTNQGCRPKHRSAEQKQFELEIQNYNGEDPLSVWHKYILWGERNLSTNDPKGKFQSLIENCCANFKDEARYKNDSRFLDIWLRVINNCSTPLEIYEFLYSNKMFVELASFYQNWATESEKKGLYNQADSIYSKGIKHGTKIAKALQKHHRQFLARMNSRPPESMETEEVNSDHRFPLMALKHQDNNDPSLKKVECLSGTTSSVKTFKLKKQTAFEIHNENQSSSTVTKTVEEKPFPANHPNTTQLINQDEKYQSHTNESDVKKTQHSKPNLVLQNEEMKSRVDKKIKSSSVKIPNEKAEAEVQYHPKYCKSKIYNGSEEFSFEELRLRIWFKKNQAKIDIQRLVETMLSEWQEKQQKFIVDQISNLMKTNPALNYSSESMSQDAHISKIAETLHRTLNDDQLEGLREKTIQIALANFENKVPNVQPANANIVASRSPNPISSPTVCTKEANLAMQNIFSKTLNLYQEEKKNSSENCPTLSQVDPVQQVQDVGMEAIPGKAYTIYSDETNTISKGLVQDADMNSCENDVKENAAPLDYVQVKEKRPLAGILQPSVNIPHGIEEPEEPMEIKEDDNFPDIQPLNLEDEFTLAPPRNSMAFAENARIISTPICGFAKTPFYSDDITFCPQRGLRDESMCNNMFKRPSIPAVHEETKWNRRPSLGVIIETSRENRTFSSSSNKTGSHTSGLSSVHTCASNSSIEWPKQIDPFEESLKNELLKRLLLPLNARSGIVYISSKVPTIKGHSTILLDDTRYIIYSQVAKGAYAKVYNAEIQCDTNESSINSPKTEYILKVEHIPSSWEFYITDELLRRLHQNPSKYDAKPGIVQYSRAYIFNDGGILTTNYIKNGTLLDFLNLLKRHKQNYSFEGLIIYFTIELLHMIHQMHQCQIIHADIKPDNILVMSMPELNLYTEEYSEMFPTVAKSLRFIDFGRSIDMSLLPPNTTFNQVIETEDMTCPEMIDGRPWTYQVDMFGLVSVIHCMLFDDYVKMKKVNGMWKLSNSFKRYWQTELWQDFFTEFLNIPDCNQQPDLMKWCQRFQETFVKSKLHSDFGFHCSRFDRILEKK